MSHKMCLSSKLGLCLSEDFRIKLMSLEGKKHKLMSSG